MENPCKPSDTGACGDALQALSEAPMTPEKWAELVAADPNIAKHALLTWVEASE